MGADIEVRSLFMMKGKGAVAIGYLRQGTAHVGQRTQPLALPADLPQVLTLAAVEVVHAIDGSSDALGLVFRERPSLDDLRSVLTRGTVLHLEDPALDSHVCT
jgi:hypothetical protein